MRKRFIQWCNEWVCKHYGHKIVEEVYAQDLRYTFGFTRKKLKIPLYIVMKECKCERCGKHTIEEMSRPMHRSELLRHGWFIEK